MTSGTIGIVSEAIELSLEIGACPERHVIQKLAADRSDQSFDERMRNWNIGNGLDLVGPNHEHVGLSSDETRREDDNRS